MTQQVDTILRLRHWGARTHYHGGKNCKVGGRKFPTKHLKSAMKIEQAERRKRKRVYTDQRVEYLEPSLFGKLRRFVGFTRSMLRRVR